MAITFFQISGDKIIVIDYYENSDEDISHYIELLNFKEYKYKAHLAPHDINRRELLSGKTRLQRARDDYGLEFTQVKQSTSVIEDINFIRRMFHRIHIREENCGRLIECLDNYRKQYDQKNSIFKSKPNHDEFSDGADSFRYMILGLDLLDTGDSNFDNIGNNPNENTWSIGGSGSGWMR